MRALTLVTGLGATLVAGALGVFTLMVMPALAGLSDPAGAAAMQSVNRTAVRPPFMLLFLGTAVLCLVLAGLELAGDRRPLVLAGAGLYLIGVLGVTVLANVPLNDTLARADVSWPDYLQRWTAWNTVRSIAGLAGGALLAVVLATGE